MKVMSLIIGTFSCWMLCLPPLFTQVFPTTIIQDNGDPDNRINFVYLSDGYTNGQLPDFLIDAEVINNDLFSQPPFSNYAAFFNAYAVQVPSNQSGADHPGDATDVQEPDHPVQYVDTYFDSTFDYFNIHRLLVPTNDFGIYSVLVDNVPEYDQAMIVVNSPYYGGSGGAHATTSVEQWASEIAIHEIGHSFADLSDEYYAGDIYAGESHNMTQETNPSLVKWEEWYGEQGIGIYQHCCGGASASWYRPHQDCKMRYLGAPFCAVCTQRIIDVIYSLVSPIDGHTPNDSPITADGNPLIFDLNLTYPSPNTLTINWLLNGDLIASEQETLTLTSGELATGINVLTARVLDKTPLSRSYLPAEGYTFDVSWQIYPGQVNVSDLPAALSGLTVQPNPNRDGHFTLSVDPSLVGSRIEVSSLDGRRLQSLELQGTSMDLWIKNKGVSVLKIIHPDGFATHRKVVVLD